MGTDTNRGGTPPPTGGRGRNSGGTPPPAGGRGRNSGGTSSSSGGRGRNKGGSFGTGGLCVCASCGHSEPHVTGVKCTTIKCPSCGKPLVRKELLSKRDNGEKE